MSRLINVPLAKVLEKPVERKVGGHEDRDERSRLEEKNKAFIMIPTAFMPCNPVEHPHDINLNAR